MYNINFEFPANAEYATSNWCCIVRIITTPPTITYLFLIKITQNTPFESKYIRLLLSK